MSGACWDYDGATGLGAVSPISNVLNVLSKGGGLVNTLNQFGQVGRELRAAGVDTSRVGVRLGAGGQVTLTRRPDTMPTQPTVAPRPRVKSPVTPPQQAPTGQAPGGALVPSGGIPLLIPPSVGGSGGLPVLTSVVAPPAGPGLPPIQPAQAPSQTPTGQPPAGLSVNVPVPTVQGPVGGSAFAVDTAPMMAAQESVSSDVVPAIAPPRALGLSPVMLVGLAAVLAYFVTKRK